jgi:hypothetical protein
LLFRLAAIDAANLFPFVVAHGLPFLT